MRLPFARPRTAAARIEPRLIPAAPARPVEQRYSDAIGGFGLAGQALADPVSSIVAENASGVAACVGAISSTLSSLPIRCYRDTPDGRVELGVRDHWLPGLLRNPCPQATWPELCEFLLSSALLHGNGLLTISYDRDGQPVELFPVPWSRVTPVLLPAGDHGKLAFNVTNFARPLDGSGVVRRYLATECLHLKDRSDYSCWIGRSRLARSPLVVETALGLGQFSLAVFRNMTAIGGVLSHPGELSPEAKINISRSWSETFGGAERARKTAILEEGLVYTPISADLEQSETLETRKFSVVEIARIFHVPPSIIQSMENNAFSSAEQQNRNFATLTLTPWARKLEAAIGKALLGDEPDTHVEIDFTALVRGDFAARWQSYATARQNDILTTAEIREQEGFGPMPFSAQTMPAGEP